MTAAMLASCFLAAALVFALVVIAWLLDRAAADRRTIAAAESELENLRSLRAAQSQQAPRMRVSRAYCVACDGRGTVRYVDSNGELRTCHVCGGAGYPPADVSGADA